MDKVLIVQRPNCVELEREYLSDVIDIEIVEDVVIALYKIKKENYKLIILDMAASRICGMDLLRIIRSNPKNHHLKIALSAQNYNYKYITEGFNQGADFFIKIPFEIKELEEIVLSLNNLENYIDLEKIAKHHEYDYLSNI
jgi:DNA-binding response OmpR family regulator